MIGLFVFIVVVVGVGAGYLAYRNRQPSSIESGISSFRREMDALAPHRRERRDMPQPRPGLGEIRSDQPDES